MMPPADLDPYLEDLERFADGQMSALEQETFEERLLHEEPLRQAYAVYEQLTADLRWVAGHETLRLRLLAQDRRFTERETALTRVREQQRHTHNRWLVLVVGVLIIALATWIFAQRTLNETSRSAWEALYEPDPGLPAAIIHTESRPLLAEAMQQYQEEHYPAALHALRRVPGAALGQDTLLYYSGIFLLRQGNATAAQPYLRRAGLQPGTPLAGQANYHLGMAYWRNQQLPDARAALDLVATDARNPYQAAARRVLQSEDFRTED